MIDAKALVIGQKIWMQSGDQFKEVAVTEITEKYIEAKPLLFGDKERPWIIRFQRNGKQFVKTTKDEAIGGFGVYEWYEADGFTGWWREDPRPLCTAFGQWELTDTAPH